MRKVFLFLLLCSWACLALGGQNEKVIDRNGEWFTLTTPHFQIHYTSGQRQPAKRVAKIAEVKYQMLTEKVGWEPSKPTQIRLVDFFDYSNGYATPLPYDRIEMIVSPPDDINQLEDYNDWLDLLFTHEYTHVLHLGESREMPATVQKFLGRNPLTFPHFFQPDFMVEGYAIHLETNWKEGYGRGQSSIYQMILRMEVDGGLKPITQVNMDGHSWPYGKSYIYGSYFFQFLEQKYGYEKFRKWLNDYSGNLIPYLMNSTGRPIFNKSFQELWDEYQMFLREKFEPQIERVKTAGIVAGKPITEGFITRTLAKATLDGMYFVRTNADNHTALMFRNREGKVAYLHKLERGSYINPHPKAGVLVAQLKADDKLHAYYDLYLYSHDGKFKRLTSRERYRRAIWMPDGKQIIALRYVHGVPELNLLDQHGGYLYQLWRGEIGDVVSDFDISPNGKRMVASRKRDYQTWNLELFDLENRSWRILTQTRQIENAPSFTNNGQEVLFSADYKDGIYNLYKLDPASGEIIQLTRVLGGAFAPTEDPVTGDVIYLGYRSMGYDLFLLDSPIMLNQFPVTQKNASTHYVNTMEKDIEDTGKESGYSVLPTLMPTTWLPWLSIEDESIEIGAFVGGLDASQTHTYQLGVFYECNSKRPSGFLDYSYDWPFTGRLGILLQRENNYYEDSDELVKVRASDKIETTHRNAWTADNLRWRFNYGLLLDKDHDTYHRNESVLRAPSYENNLIGFNVVFDNREEFQKSFFPEEGLSAEFLFESNDVISSDYKGNGYTLICNDRIPLPRHNALSLTVSVGFKDQEAKSYRLSGSDNPFADIGLLGRERYRLRGYPDSDDKELRGHRMQLNSVEWLIPITNLERTWGMFPLGIQRMSANLFADTGTVWEKGENPGKYRTGVGVELKLEVGLMGLGDIDTIFGFAVGLNDTGENQVYFRLNLPL